MNMKTIIFVFSAFLYFSITGCDDECINCTPASYCGFEEFSENAAMSTCLAEDYLTGFGCPNISCFSSDPSINDGDLSACTVIDCQTLSCEEMRVGGGDPQPGFIEDISLEEMTGTPIGIFEVDEFMSEFRCLPFVS